MAKCEAELFVDVQTHTGGTNARANQSQPVTPLSTRGDLPSGTEDTMLGVLRLNAWPHKTLLGLQTGNAKVFNVMTRMIQ